jgi:hypothetical protein
MMVHSSCQRLGRLLSVVVLLSRASQFSCNGFAFKYNPALSIVATVRTSPLCLAKNNVPFEPADDIENRLQHEPQGGGETRRSLFGQMLFAASAFSLLNENPGGPQVANAASAIDDDSPKIVLWGFGNQNKLMAKYLYEKKISVVGVVSRHDIGEDYGLVDLDAWGKAIGKTTGVKIVDEQSAASMLAKTQPDVCIISTRSTLEDLKPLLIACADAKVNVITIAEELLYSFPASPKLTEELDERFKAAGVSFTGSGFIDGACGEMILAMSSMMQRIDTVEGFLQDNVDVYGAVVAVAFGIGLTKAQFQKEFVQKTTQDKSYFYYYNEWLAKALGLTSVSTKEGRLPTFASRDIESKALGKVIPAGEVTGMEVTVTTQTKEGVSIVSRLIGKIYEPDEKGINEWGFKGEPQGVKFTMTDFPTPQMTNTASISRIPQIIAAPPGYVTTDHFEITRYYQTN